MARTNAREKMVNRMDDLISRQAILKHIEKIRQGALMMDDIRRASIIMNGMYLCEEAAINQPSADAVEVVRCKDCKHRPTGESRDDLEFPDDKCPCKCEDYWYSWKPSDNWFCGNGERKDSNYRGERKYG